MNCISGTDSDAPTVLPRSPYFSFASTTILRPSGVSSASEASCAVSASSVTLVLSTGFSSTACRLPSVIVPVLSRRRTSISPAASMALPEVVMTFRRIRRSMPAIPIALSSPPIVVGARQTKSATSTVTVTGTPAPADFTL